MTKLAVQLVSSQIEAAERLYQRQKPWQLSNAALYRLKDCCPGFDHEETLLKVVAINALYGTNLYALVRMAEHICKTLKGKDLNAEGPELVEMLACLPASSDEKKSRHHASFASKFAHFFVDSESFPIMDSIAVEMLKHHLGQGQWQKDSKRPYLAFVANIERLRQRSGIDCTNSELDRYLWLAGLFRRWDNPKDGKINREASILFANQSPDVARDVKSLTASGT
ncbi:MAG: hypothetical protein JWM11_2325 [Planctomycetaceae bacterium]|nr:hypothetical protein [Planctomycetaceae bacterium]